LNNTDVFDCCRLVQLGKGAPAAVLIVAVDLSVSFVPGPFFKPEGPPLQPASVPVSVSFVVVAFAAAADWLPIGGLMVTEPFAGHTTASLLDVGVVVDVVPPAVVDGEPLPTCVVVKVFAGRLHVTNTSPTPCTVAVVLTTIPLMLIVVPSAPATTWAALFGVMSSPGGIGRGTTVAMSLPLICTSAGVSVPLIVAGPSVVPEPATTLDAPATRYVVFRSRYEVIVNPWAELGSCEVPPGKDTENVAPGATLLGATACTVMSWRCDRFELPRA
jgi:hypothetical protein